jgi:surfeit locus 1 family protein
LNRAERSLLWPTLAAGVIFALLCGLGAWQLARLAEKTALIEAASAQLTAPPGPLPDDLSRPETLDFRRVAVEGRLVGNRVLYRNGSSPAGRAGLRALAPLALDDGRMLLTDLGWLPLDRKGEPLPLPEDRLVVEGVLRTPRAPNWLTPANNPANNAWAWLDLPAMAEALGVAQLAPVLLRAESMRGNDGAPRLEGLERGPEAVDLENNHLEYALTWFALAGGMAVIYLLFVSRRRRRTGVP